MSRASFLTSNLYSAAFLPSASSSSGLLARVTDAHVVHRVDDPLAEEVRPDDVADVPGERRVLRAGEPVGEGGAVVLARLRSRARSPPRNFGFTGRSPTGCRISPAAALKTVSSRGSWAFLYPTWLKNAAKP